MALDKLVDSTQLDNNLTSVANAIRAKSGGTGQLAFPAGFVSEIGNISGGGGGGNGAANGSITPAERTLTMTLEVGTAEINHLVVLPKIETPLKSNGKTVCGVIANDGLLWPCVILFSNNAGFAMVSPSIKTSAEISFNSYVNQSGSVLTITLPSSVGYFETIEYAWRAW